jgi:hypothetical protein
MNGRAFADELILILVGSFEKMTTILMICSCFCFCSCHIEFLSNTVPFVLNYPIHQGKYVYCILQSIPLRLGASLHHNPFATPSLPIRDPNYSV